MSLYGVSNMDVTDLKVLRYNALQDLTINVTLESSLRLDGRYILDVKKIYNVCYKKQHIQFFNQGTALGVLPVSGNGYFTIVISSMIIDAHTFLAWSGDKQSLIMRHLDIHLDLSGLYFDFQDLMGGGLMGQTLNLIINFMGGVVIDQQKSFIHSKVAEVFHDTMSDYL